MQWVVTDSMCLYLTASPQFQSSLAGIVWGLVNVIWTINRRLRWVGLLWQTSLYNLVSSIPEAGVCGRRIDCLFSVLVVTSACVPVVSLLDSGCTLSTNLDGCGCTSWMVVPCHCFVITIYSSVAVDKIEIISWCNYESIVAGYPLMALLSLLLSTLYWT